MPEPTSVSALLQSLADPGLWHIFPELVTLPEIDRSGTLRPHDEVGLSSDKDEIAVNMRARLDTVLGILTLAEIAIELGLLTDTQVRAAAPIDGLDAFRTLVAESDAFYRYASAYLYFGARLLSYRCFGFLWPDQPPPAGPAQKRMNRRLFSLKTPPPLLINDQTTADPRKIFETFLCQHPHHADWAEALLFLDGFHPVSPSLPADTLDRPSLREPARFELWLRGLLPEATPAEQTRFETIRRGLVAWAEARKTFYLNLQRECFFAAGDPNAFTQPFAPSRDAILTNPLTARFALADIYWLACLFRAEVSTDASVSNTRSSWLQLIRFKAGLDRRPDDYVDHLKDCEKILEAVFGFVCDLVQNSIDLTVRAELRHYNPPAPSPTPEKEKPTKEWRAVFDEELREIDRQRSQRTHMPSAFKNGEAYPYNANDPNEYWSERLLTGRQPHDRIGLAFSGGGIRSATFNLGVLQGLQELDLLRSVDYLSTVSGGGFIGSWLVGNVHRTRQWLGRATRWDESVQHLRSYASYLAPLNGLLSADTWTLVATWVRNTFLIQLTGFFWLLAVLLGVLECRRIFLDYASTRFHLSIPYIWRAGMDLTDASLLACALALAVTVIIMASFTRGGVETGKDQSKFAAHPWIALVGWLGSFVIAAIQWRISKDVFFTPVHSFSALLQCAWQQEKLLLVADAVALFLIGLLALRRPKPAIPTRPAAAPATAAPTPGFRNRLLKFLRELTPGLIGRSLWTSIFSVVVFYLALCGILKLSLWWRATDPVRFASYAFVFQPALMLSAFAVSIVLLIGFSGRATGEAQREWWTRLGAWLVIYAVAGLALCAAAVFGPRILQELFSLSGKLHGTIKWGAVAGWLGTVIGGLFAGNSSKTAGAASSGKKLGLDLLARVGGFAFVTGVVIGSAWILFAFLATFAKPATDLSAAPVSAATVTAEPAHTSCLFPANLAPGTTNVPCVLTVTVSSAAPATVAMSHSDYWHTLDAIHSSTILLTLAVVVLIATPFAWFFEINIFGLSQFYRNRLVRCYLGATRWAPGIREPHPFTKFDFHDDFDLGDLCIDAARGTDFRGPFPIFNCTLNLGGSSDLTVHTRHSSSFSLTPLRCGSDRAKVGYAPTSNPHPNGPRFADGVRVGQAVAISGAAASPNMGYNTSPLAALLLTMFNVRLGWWFPNPGKDKWAARGLSWSLVYLLCELTGKADETRDFLNVSDGGHFENLGVYELIRRRCKVIIACDAECDDQLHFGALGNLIRICATDFAAVIELDVQPIAKQRDGHSLAHSAVGRIKYSNGSTGFLIYLKSSITGDEDIGIAQYRSAHPTFPHETTANQFFSEDQFESYRELGRHIVRHSFRGVQPGEHPVAVADRLADVTVPPRVSGEAYLKHTRTLARLWDEFRRAPALHSFLDELLRIDPATSVEPPVPLRAHRTSEEFAMALQLIQLMEDVYMDLQLEDYWEHPDNRGWAFLFMRWARSPRFRTCWNQAHRTYGIRFEYFCNAHLGLQRDDPVVRM